MIAVVITGAPGIGKTTLLPLVVEEFGGQAAFLDGDAVGRTRPLTRTKERQDVIQDNICSCANNFAAWGARCFVTTWVFPAQDRIDRMTDLLAAAGHRVVAVGLIADEDALVQRHRGRPEAYGTDPERLAAAVGLNTCIRELRNVHLIDTTSLAPNEVASAVVDYCRSIEQLDAGDGARRA